METTKIELLTAAGQGELRLPLSPHALYLWAFSWQFLGHHAVQGMEPSPPTHGVHALAF